MASRKNRKSAKEIPWTSFGRETAAARVGRSLLPVGIYPFDLAPYDPAGVPVVTSDDPNFEQYLMNIVGTAIQAGDGKLVTCHHIVQSLLAMEKKRRHYVLARFFREATVLAMSYPIQISVPFIDDRTKKPNPKIDVAILLTGAASTEELPYDVPNVKWGDSTKLGVGDPIIVGGYPYGKEMFLYTQSNRGLIQPTFYQGIISAILPATAADETRLLQLSVLGAGGLSGGAVFIPYTGEVVGMVTSGVQRGGVIPLPMTWAVPSEVIAPFVEAISFERGARGGGAGVGSQNIKYSVI